MKITVHLRVLQNTRLVVNAHTHTYNWSASHKIIVCQAAEWLGLSICGVNVVNMFVLVYMYAYVYVYIFIYIYVKYSLDFYGGHTYWRASHFIFFFLRVYLTDPAACTYLYIHSKIYVYVYKSGVKTTINLWSVVKKITSYLSRSPTSSSNSLASSWNKYRSEKVKCERKTRVNLKNHIAIMQLRLIARAELSAAATATKTTTKIYAYKGKSTWGENKQLAQLSHHYRNAVLFHYYFIFFQRYFWFFLS